MLEGIQAAQKQVARLRVDDEDREVEHGRGAAARRQRRYSPAVLIQLVDPAAYTPPYDHALATALCSAGARVELITTSSPDWDAAMQRAQPSWAAAATTAGQSTYERRLDFYRRSASVPGRLRPLMRALEHPVGLRRLRRRPADLTHMQWAPLQELDRWGLPRDRPLVITAHDVLPREARPGQRAAQRAIYARADLVIAHIPARP